MADAAPGSSEAIRHKLSSGRVVTQPAGIPVASGAAAVGGPKSQQFSIWTDACTSGMGCATIGPLALLPALRVPTGCSLLSKNF